MIDKNIIDPNALHYYRMLKEAGFSAYFVGGAVRDLLLGKKPKDFDIATNATPHQIKRVIPQGRIIGRRFRHVMLERDSGRYEIVTFRGPVLHPEPLDEETAENPEIAPEAQQDAAMAAAEQERRFPDLNQFGTAQQDAIRRDFTINALFYDPDADELVDYVDGKLDVDQKIIRTIGDAKIRMEEDPIRILRAIRHKTKLGLEYDPYLIQAMQEKAPLLDQTSKDRIREEFLKVCNDRSLGHFLAEVKQLGIEQFVMPWFADTDEASWNQAMQLWIKFADSESLERISPDMGLSLMMTPLIEPLVLVPYKASVPEGEKNYLPDMKYFLSCEPLRNYFLRNLRISRAQTDHIVRALFYWNRMTGLWVENGPPRRVIGRLFQHPPALLAAKMARLFLDLQGKPSPDWLIELADFNPRERNDRRPQRDGRERNDREDRGDRGERPGNRNQEEPRRHQQAPQQADHADDYSDDQPRRDEQPEERQPTRLAAPDQPMVWNGPLHAPVLRPTFSEELPNRWARKNQTICAYRPSGIPNQPTDYAMLKSHLVSNYKPELETPVRGEENGDRSSGPGPRNNRGRRDGRERNDRRPARGDRPHGQHARHEQGPENSEASPRSAGNEQDEDSFGNILRPGEQPALLEGAPSLPPLPADNYIEEDDEDNIGNRLDAPPTSGHVGINGEGVLGSARNNQPNRHGGGGQNRGGAPGPGGPRNNRGRRGGRRHGGGRSGGGGGGPGRNFRGPNSAGSQS